MTAITSRELVLSDGTRQAVGLVVNAWFEYPRLQIDDHLLQGPLTPRENLRLSGFEHVWVTSLKGQATERRFLTTADWVALGKRAGQNAWASS